MQFERKDNKLESIGIGKTKLLYKISYIQITFLQSDLGRWRDGIFLGNSIIRGSFTISDEYRGPILLEKLEQIELSRKWLRRFFNLTQAQIEEVDHIGVFFGINPENKRENGPTGLSYGEFIYEHDKKIYNIPEKHILLDDLFINFRRTQRRWLLRRD